ncbi:MAG: hypothetical protein WC745_00850 [Patescibacteria group bacterium]|jgi:hypothetical protein
MTYFKRLLAVLAISVIGFTFFSGAAKAAVNSPVIEEVKKGAENTLSMPMITGTTDLGTDALIYIDGTYRGTGVANILLGQKYRFFFQEKVNLSEGAHSVMAVARNKTTLELSSPSASVQFIVPAVPAPIPAPAPTPAPIPASLPAPTILSPNPSTRTGDPRETIKGLTKSGTLVHIYIDGVYNGKTKVVYHSSGTGAFYYKPFLDLKRGEHQVWAVAEDIYGNKSKASVFMNFRIEYPMPAPTMIRAVVNNNTTAVRPFITGVAKNNSEVLVFIDKKADGAFLVKNHPSGTANFAYKPSYDLSKDITHKIQAQAIDIHGKESILSNSVYYLFPKPAVKAAQVAPKKISGTSKITAPKSVQQEEKKTAPETGTKKTPGTEDNKTDDGAGGSLDNLLNGNEVSEKAGTSSILSSITSKLSLNLIIFLIFLVGVIGWIFWVNRELARERKEREISISEETKKEGNPYLNQDQNKNI